MVSYHQVLNAKIFLSWGGEGMLKEPQIWWELSSQCSN